MLNKEDIRKDITNQIQNAVNGCDTYWAGLIADHLISVGITLTPELAKRFDYVQYKCPQCGTTAFVESAMAVDCGICHVSMVQRQNEDELVLKGEKDSGADKKV